MVASLYDKEKMRKSKRKIECDGGRVYKRGRGECLCVREWDGERQERVKER